MTTIKRKSKQVLSKQVITPTISKRTPTNLYIGETDPAQYIHSNKTHRTTSEAFRDAQYAMWLYGAKTDFMLTMDFLANAFVGALWVLCVVGGVGGFIYWLFRG